MKAVNIILNTLIFTGDARMLAQMVEPRIMLKELDIMPGSGGPLLGVCFR
jgi:hypothetical protein